MCNRLSPQTRSVCIAHQSQHPIIIVAYSPSLNPDHLSKLSWLELKMHLKDLRVKICQSVLKLEGLESRLFVCSALPTWTPPSYMRPSPPPSSCSFVRLQQRLLSCCSDISAQPVFLSKRNSIFPPTTQDDGEDVCRQGIVFHLCRPALWQLQCNISRSSDFCQLFS